MSDAEAQLFVFLIIVGMATVSTFVTISLAVGVIAIYGRITKALKRRREAVQEPIYVDCFTLPGSPQRRISITAITYLDHACTIPHSQPIVADPQGNFPPIYLKRGEP